MVTFFICLILAIASGFLLLTLYRYYICIKVDVMNKQLDFEAKKNRADYDKSRYGSYKQ